MRRSFERELTLETPCGTLEPTATFCVEDDGFPYINHCVIGEFHLSQLAIELMIGRPAFTAMMNAAANWWAEEGLDAALQDEAANHADDVNDFRKE